MVHINELYPDTMLRLEELGDMRPAEQYLINYRRQEVGLSPLYKNPINWKRDLYTRLAEHVASEFTLGGQEPNVRVYLLDKDGARTATFDDVVSVSVEKTATNDFTLGVETELPSFAENYRKYTSANEYINDVIKVLKGLVDEEYLRRTFCWNIRDYLGAETYLEHEHDKVYLGDILSEMNEQTVSCRKEFNDWVEKLKHM